MVLRGVMHEKSHAVSRWLLTNALSWGLYRALTGA